MKKLFVVFLSVIILCQTLVSVGFVIYYQVNKAYITQQLCENRSNPQLHCNGHCYLSKQLKKAEEGEQKQMPNILKEKEEIVTSTPDDLPARYYPAFVVTVLSVSIETPHTISPVNTLIKPPVA